MKLEERGCIQEKLGRRGGGDDVNALYLCMVLSKNTLEYTIFFLEKLH